MSQFDLILGDRIRQFWNLLSLAGYVTTRRSGEQSPVVNGDIFPWRPTGDLSQVCD